MPCKVYIRCAVWLRSYRPLRDVLPLRCVDSFKASWWNQVIQGLPRGHSIALRLDRTFETVEEGMRRRGAKALELSSR